MTDLHKQLTCFSLRLSASRISTSKLHGRSKCTQNTAWRHLADGHCGVRCVAGGRCSAAGRRVVFHFVFRVVLPSRVVRPATKRVASTVYTFNDRHPPGTLTVIFFPHNSFYSFFLVSRPRGGSVLTTGHRRISNNPSALPAPSRFSRLPPCLVFLCNKQNT